MLIVVVWGKLLCGNHGGGLSRVLLTVLEALTIMNPRVIMEKKVVCIAD